LDPHGAVGYLGLKRYQQECPGTTGIFLETAHPAKFKETVETVLSTSVEMPSGLLKFLSREKKTTQIKNHFEDLKNWLMRESS
jgi:threonine synthase